MWGKIGAGWEGRFGFWVDGQTGPCMGVGGWLVRTELLKSQNLLCKLATGCTYGSIDAIYYMHIMF